VPPDESSLEEFFGSAEFEWDEYNAHKIWERHKVALEECEQVFFNAPFVVAEDIKHSEDEKRFYSLGHSNGGRLLFVVFTLRKRRIRVISARDMSRREREVYELS
jgi:uncharacterized protein